MPQRQIRALYDDDSITLYQAYSTAIALPAIKEQKLSASPEYKQGRMTWVKPSWCWMMYDRSGSAIRSALKSIFRYRSGYSFKDKGQEHILALRMSHQRFQELLGSACLSTHVSATTTPDQVRVQWDPERGPQLEKLTYRSIQIGIPGAQCKRWVEDGILSIEDVTERARGLKRVLDADQGKSTEDLVNMGLLPTEREYPLPTNLAQRLGMTE